MAKTKKKLTNRGSIEERAQARQKIGRLKDQKLRPTTLLRYINSVTLFINWLEGGSTPIPRQPDAWDAAISDYAEHLWETGESKQLFGDLLSGLPHFLAETRGSLKGSWKLFATWKRLELPVRAVPFSTDVLLAMMGAALMEDDLEQAGAYILGFMCMLRTGELVSLRWGDLSFHPRPLRMVVRLGLTKGGQRRGLANETVVCDDPATIRFLSALHGTFPRGDIVVGKTPQRFRQIFNAHLKYLHIDRHCYFPYSLRRGGATSQYRATGNLAWVAVQGRWASQSTARIYIDDGMAAIQEQNFPPEAIRTVAKHASLALELLQGA